VKAMGEREKASWVKGVTQKRKHILRNALRALGQTGPVERHGGMRGKGGPTWRTRPDPS
jgi:hypothetical protein